MISLHDYRPVGTIMRPHGTQGEVTLNIETDFDRKHCQWLIVPIEGIPVPLFVKIFYEKNGHSCAVHFEGINTVKEAQLLCGQTAYADPVLVQQAEPTDSAYNYIGFAIEDAHVGRIGVIEKIDDSTPNKLFVVNGDIYIPATEVYITAVDVEQHVIYTALPQGLIELNTKNK